MAKQISSRSKRRMEKRQAVWMLSLVLVVSLISFGLGIMVGKRGTPPMTQQENPALVTRLPISPEPAEEKEAAPAPAASEQAAKSPHLTFYETLAETQKQPLGTGINLPPQTQPTAVKPAEPPVEKQPDAQQRPSTPPVTVAAPGDVAKTEVAASAGYVVQTGSFKRPEDAERLRSQLTVKGYEVFIQQADLKEKGVWYRVLLGPVASKNEAEALAADLKKRERLAGFVRTM